MPHRFPQKKRLSAAISLFILLTLLFMAGIEASAQKGKKRPATDQTATQQGNANTTTAQQQKPPKKNITPLHSGDTTEGSRITITSDAPLNDYSAYRSGDRYYVIIPEANAPRAQAGMRGRGFEDVQVQKRGNDAILSFRLQPGTNARVNQKFNRLDVELTAPGGGVAKNPSVAPTPAQTPEVATQPTPRATPQTQIGPQVIPGTGITGRTQFPQTNPNTTNPALTPQTNGANPPPIVYAPTPEGSPNASPEASAETSPAATPSSDQVAQNVQPPAQQPATTDTSTSSTTLGTFLRTNWLLILIGALALLSVVLIIAAYSRSERTAPPPPALKPEGKEKRAVSGDKAVAELKEADAAPLVTAAVSAPAVAEAEVSEPEISKPEVGPEEIIAPVAAVEAVKAVETDETPAAAVVEEETIERAPVPAVNVERVETEVKNVLAGEDYDEEIVGASDAETRRLVAAELLSALAARNVTRRERARDVFIKHHYLDEATRNLRTAEAPAERAAAARSLGYVKDSAATPHLVAALEDEAPEVRRASVEALAELRDPAAHEPLSQLLERERDRKVPKNLIRRAIEASTAVEEETPTLEAEHSSADLAGLAIAGGALLAALPVAEETETSEDERAAQRVAEEEEARRREEEEARQRAEEERAAEEARRQAEEDARLAAAEAEAKRVAEEEEARRIEEEARLKAEEEARQKAEEEARLAAEAEAKRLAEEEEARQRAEEEARLAREEEERKQAEEAARLKAEEEERARLKAEEEERQRLAEEARLQAEEEARLRAEEEERERQAEAERLRLEEAARLRAEEEARRQAEEEKAERRRVEEARLAAEAEAKRLAEEEAARLRAEEEARLKAEEEARLKAEEEERLRAEAEAKRLAEEEEARRREEEAARQRAEEEARQKAEEEARLRAAEEETRLAAEAEAKRLAEEEAARQRAEEEEARRHAEEEARLAREEEERKASAEAARQKAEEEEQARLKAKEERRRAAEELAAAEAAKAEPPPLESLLERGDESAYGWVDVDVTEPQAAPYSTPHEFVEDASIHELAPDAIVAESEVTKEIIPTLSAVEEPLVTGQSDYGVTENGAAEKGIATLDEFSTVPGAILKRLSSEEPSERAAAVTDLARVGGDDSFREISAAFDDPAVEVRNAAARSLFYLNTDRAATFTRALREAPPERRRKIGSALASSGLASEAIGQLMGESREKTYDAFSLLFLMSKAGEVQPLMRAIEEHPNNEVRLAVVKLLALSGQQEILPAFRRLAVRGSLPTEVRSAVMEAIYQISSQSPTAA